MQKGNTGEILRWVMAVTGTKQVDIAAQLGILQSSVSGNLNRRKMGLDVFERMLQVMGYTVAICKLTDEMVTFKYDIGDTENIRDMMMDALSEAEMKKFGLAKALGVTPAAVSGHINRPRIGTDVFTNIMNAMGYSVLVGHKTDSGFEALWEVGQDE